ncbi:MAG: rhodanese-like domain-containing protein [Thermoanaerobaculia bacterium]|nr:rhodanese-like domain-containing protein [Thermoanaerobaculia bacterium]
MIKGSMLAVIGLSGLLFLGCQEEPPEPEVTADSSPIEQPAPPPSDALPGEPMESPGDDATTSSEPMTPDDVERITIEELSDLPDEEVVVVDVRSSQYYIEGHIPGAINIPAGQTVQMIDMLPKGKKIVTYCT